VPDLVREPFRGERPIMRVDLAGTVPGAADHTTVVFMQAEAGEVGVRPEESRLQEGNGSGPARWKSYVWRHSAGVIDVLVVRSAAVYRDEALREDTVFPLSEAGDALVVLPAAADYGFARLRFDAGAEGWAVAPLTTCGSRRSGGTCLCCARSRAP